MKRDTHRRSNHANYYEQRVGHKIVVAEHVEDYRDAVTHLIRPDDLALEIGCHGGETTRILGKFARLTYGVDKTVSPARLQEQERNASSRVRFREMDANNIGGLMELSKEAAEEVSKDGPDAKKGFSVVLIDISGNVTFKSLFTLIDIYESSGVFGTDLRLIIVKSFRFASLLDRAKVFEKAVDIEEEQEKMSMSTGSSVAWRVASVGFVIGAFASAVVLSVMKRHGR